MFTFVKGVKTDDFNFKVSIKGHLSIDIFAEGGLPSCWSSGYSHNYLLSDLVAGADLPVGWGIGCIHVVMSLRYYYQQI